MILNFKYDGFSYEDFDTNDENSMKALERHIGKAKLDEILQNPEPYIKKDKFVTKSEMIADISTLQVDIKDIYTKSSITTEGVIEADTKASSAQADTVALFEGVLDVDTRLIQLASETVKSPDFVQLQQTVNELTVKVNKILEHLNLTM